MYKRSALIVFSLALASVATSGAEAREAGVYSFVHIGATGGGVAGGPGRLDSNPEVFADETAEGAGSLSLSGGAPWFCLTPGCGVTVGPLAGLGWAAANTNPFLGTIGLRTGAFQNGGPAPLNCAMLPGIGEICQPVDPWGTASAYGYVSKLVEVTSDGSLAPGESVDVSGALNLSGAFTDDLSSEGGLYPAGGLHAVVFISRIADRATDPYWNSGPYLNYGGVTDILGDLGSHGGELLGFISFKTDSLTGPDTNVLTSDVEIEYVNSLLVGAAVGDLLLLETMFYVQTVLHNDAQGHVAWSEFAQTFGTTFSALTPGAALTTVPVPAALPLLLVGLLSLGRVLPRTAAAGRDRGIP